MYPILANDPKFYSESDAKTIQNAIRYAKETGVNAIVIPPLNPRTKTNEWIIEKAILLPSEITITIDNARLTMTDNVISHCFTNSLAWTEEGNKKENEEHDIRIIGIGHAVLDGGKPNGTCEQLHRDNPSEYPNMYRNLPIYLHNVSRFEISGLSFENTRYWAICLMYARFGSLRNIDIRNYGTVENQDGIDLRIGCEYITIENITGITGDDTLALTALPNEEAESTQWVSGKSFDIHDISVRNIISATHGCGIVRFLCENGAREYNITVDGIKDTGKAISGSAVLFGTNDAFFIKNGCRKMGDLRNIVIKNISTSAQRGISFTEPCEDVFIENLNIYGKNECGLRFSENFVAKNVQVKNVTIHPNPETAKGAFVFKNNPEENLRGLMIENVTVENEPYIFCNRQIPVKNLRYEEPTESYFTENTPKLLSAYMRYFKTAYGKEAERPKDNRIDGTLRIEDEY